MPKILVTATVIISDDELKAFAYGVQFRWPHIKAEKFLEDIYSGNQARIDYPDKTATTYEIIKEN